VTFFCAGLVLVYSTSHDRNGWVVVIAVVFVVLMVWGDAPGLTAKSTSCGDRESYNAVPVHVLLA
jgi:hypothetical protein